TADVLAQLRYIMIVGRLRQPVADRARGRQHGRLHLVDAVAEVARVLALVLVLHGPLAREARAGLHLLAAQPRRKVPPLLADLRLLEPLWRYQHARRPIRVAVVLRKIVDVEPENRSRLDVEIPHPPAAVAEKHVLDPAGLAVA